MRLQFCPVIVVLRDNLFLWQNICRNGTNFTVALHAVMVVGMEQLFFFCAINHCGHFVQLIIVSIYTVTVFSCMGQNRLFDFNYCD